MEINSFIKLNDRTPREVFFSLKRRIFSKTNPLPEFDEKHPCVFVLSTGRVATHTLSAIFGLNSTLFSYHEPIPKLYSLSKLAYDYSERIYNDPYVKNIFCTAFKTIRKKVLEKSLFYGKGYVEASPQVTFLYPIIRELIPNAYFIHLIRDPRKVIRSAMRRGWYAGHSADNTRITPLPGSKIYDSWRSLNSFQKNCWLWAETNRWIHEFGLSLLSDNFCMVKSEDIFNAKEKVIKKLFNFINLPAPPQEKIKRVLKRSLNAQKTGEFPEYDAWSNEMKAQLINISGNVATMMGYFVGHHEGWENSFIFCCTKYIFTSGVRLISIPRSYSIAAIL